MARLWRQGSRGLSSGRQEVLITVSFAWYLPSSALFPQHHEGRTALSGKAQALSQAAYVAPSRSTSRAVGAMGAPSHMPRFREGWASKLGVLPGVRLGGAWLPPALRLRRWAVAAAAGDAPLGADRIDGGAFGDTTVDSDDESHLAQALRPHLPAAARARLVESRI